MAETGHTDQLHHLDAIALPTHLGATAADSHGTGLLTGSLDLCKHARIEPVVVLTDQKVARAIHHGYRLRLQVAGLACGKTPAKIHRSALSRGDGANLG